MTSFWPWVWYGLGVTAAIWVPFAFIEARAFKHPEKQWTLSRAFATMPPIATFIVGFIAGGFIVGLSVHFWWHWCPFGGVGAG